MSVRAVLRSCGGVARARELAGRGIGAGLLRRATASGEIVRVRKGWYALPELGSAVLRALRVGGELGCIGAARHAGLWVPGSDEQLHVMVRRDAARLRSPDDHRRRLDGSDPVVVHWSARTPRLVQPLPQAIALAARCAGAEVAFVLLESALARRALDDAGYEELRRLVPGWFEPWLRFADASSESGTESIVKLLLRELGLPFRQQVTVPGVGRVDFLVGEALAIEVDSRAHHGDLLRDRRRDALLSIRGIRTLRFLYSQVVHERDQVRDAIVAAVVRGDLRG